MLWSELSGSALSRAIANKLFELEGLVLTNRESEAETIAREVLFFQPGMAHRVVMIPDSETLPFDLERPSANVLSERALSLSKLSLGQIDKPVVITSVRNAMRLFAGRAFWNEQIELSIGAALPYDIEERLQAWGYSQAFRTKSPGSYSFRGKVFDVYPSGGVLREGKFAHGALRIRINDHRLIDQIKTLDPLTQESSGAHDAALLFPMRDYPLDKSIVEGFRRNAYQLHDDPRSTAVYKAISTGEDCPELNWWLSYSETGSLTLFDVLKSPHVILTQQAPQAIDDFDKLVRMRHGEVLKDSTRVIPPADRCFIPAAAFRKTLKACEQTSIVSDGTKSAVPQGFGPNGMQRKASLNETLNALQTLIQASDTVFVIKSHVREKHMSVMTTMMGYRPIMASDFQDLAVKVKAKIAQPRAFIIRGDVDQGYYCAEFDYRLITEREIFGSVIESRLDAELSEHQRQIILQGLHEIEIGEPIVHAMNGVGRFAGFERINMMRQPGMEEDVVKIAYADEAMAFVRIRDLDLVSRYSGGAPEKAPLSKINDPLWMDGIKEAQKSAIEVATDLVKIRAQREQAIGITIKPSDARYDRFCEVFIYEETPDQLHAIDDIIKDLSSGKPMDRLVCGDVGFGKTEVAMRAAFLTASQGYQVVVLAPTTILAEQHYQSFVSRFEETNIGIELANRNTLNKQDIERINSGAVSIIIGTHRLLQDDISFKNLGLIIVDEEHRFGVRQKEMLRQMRGNKHMLTLTATPIPRTLGLAISGIRDLSILATPPARRQSVRTIVKEYSDDALSVAMTREMSRNGQIFYLHNLIETMDQTVEKLQALMPNARIGKLHGKMSEFEMAQIMMEFRRHAFDVLVSTTVIEIGIDVPNANTLIVEDADKLGLAQLHQLRGRVGRSSRQAYAYLLYGANASSTGLLRLEAMEKASNLGEGVMIARHDMEIRGIGEILGEEQSGHVHNIGFTLYMRLLEQAVESISSGTPGLGIMLTSVEMPIEGRIPALFIHETGERLAWYQRLMSSQSAEELQKNLDELEDLYGYLPEEINLLKASIIKHMVLRKWGIRRIAQNETGLTIFLHDDAPNETKMLLGLKFPRLHAGERINQLQVDDCDIEFFMARLTGGQ